MIWFVRHGETVWNVENKICGATDSPLTERGHQQAIEMAEKFRGMGIKADMILYSIQGKRYCIAYFRNNRNTDERGKKII